MSASNTTKPLELAAIGIGVLAIGAAVYFEFLTESLDSVQLTNWVISLAFLVFVANNFVHSRNLRKEIGTLNAQNDELNQQNSELQSDLAASQQKLSASESSLKKVQGEVKKLQEELASLKAE